MNAKDGGRTIFAKLLRRVVYFPVALSKALTVAQIIEDRELVTPWRGKLLRVQLIQMKNRKRYFQLLLVDGDVDMRVALDVDGVRRLQGIVTEFLPKMGEHTETRGN